MNKTNKKAKINYHLFIKFGEKEYMKKLFEEGNFSLIQLIIILNKKIKRLEIHGKMLFGVGQ